MKKLKWQYCLVYKDRSKSYDSIGYLCYSIGPSQYAKAEEYFMKALRVQEKELGEDHLTCANSYNDIASLYKSMGLSYYSKAEEYHIKALRVQEKEL